jgi:hypothetical protein
MVNFDQALTATPEQAKQAYAGVTDRVSDTLTSLGVSVTTTQPALHGQTYHGELPSNLDQLSYDQLSELMRANVEWNRYLNGHRTAVNNDLTVARQQLSAVKSAIVKQRGKDSLECDTRFININVEICELEALCAALDTAIQGAKDAYKLLSRSVTIRGQDQERVARTDNFERGWATGDRSRRRGT